MTSKLLVSIVIIFILSTTIATVELPHNWVRHLLHLLLLLHILLNISPRIVVQPIDSIVDSILQIFPVLRGHVPAAIALVKHIPEVVQVGLKGVLCVDSFTNFLVLLGKPLRVLHHLPYLRLRKTSFLCRFGNCFAFSCPLVDGRHLQYATDVDSESNFDLRDATWSKRNPGQIEPSKEQVVLGQGPLALGDLNIDRWLIILVGRKDLGFFWWER
mmetsp:Transcript_6903/g.20719  ORF Transcript_6903/g.20719 Transcript_6903/m.20719 type:complete len:215 (+) Transcript_6903:630-1274(+)